MPLEIKGAGTRLGYSQQYIADKLGMSVRNNHELTVIDSDMLQFVSHKRFHLLLIESHTRWRVEGYNKVIRYKSFDLIVQFGGICVNRFAVACLFLIAILKGNTNTLFGNRF